MLVKAASRGPDDRHQDHRDDHHREDRVGQEQREVPRTEPSGLCEDGPPRVEVIIKVSGKKQGRGAERANHAVAMDDLPSFADGEVTEQEQDRAQRVQTRVEWRDVG